jgi:hypothetical protein
MKTMFVWVLLTSVALGCSCEPPSVEKVKGWADAVFVGTVSDVQFVDKEGDPAFGDKRIIVTFSVSSQWKGVELKNITLHTFYNQVSCDGYAFKQGQEYIVYAKKHKARLWLGDGDRRAKLDGAVRLNPQDFVFNTSPCARTRRVSYANEDLRQLGRPKAP